MKLLKANPQLSYSTHSTAPIAANDNFPCRLVSNRTVKTTGSTGEIYIYDPSGKLLEETSQAGVAIADYIYIDNLLVSVWKPSLPQMVSVYGDQLGTPQATTDQYWQIDWKANYQPFGTTSNVVTSGIYTGPITQNLRLPGQYADAESGFNYNGFRDYAPMLGRYLESDPIGLNGGMNTYGYVGQNPLVNTDRSGLCFEDACVGEIALGEIGLEELYDLYKAWQLAQQVAQAAANPPAQLPPPVQQAQCPTGLNSDNAAGQTNGAAGDGASAGDSGTADGAGTDGQTPLPDDATVCRGGQCTAERFTNGSGVTTDSDGNLQGVSVQSGTGTVEDLTQSIPNGQVGVTTVGDVRAAGGDVVSSSGNGPNHATLSGITAQQAETLFTPTIKNPNR